jgi:hypothetical protein
LARRNAAGAVPHIDAKHHLIVAHEVTNIGNDRSQLSIMAKQAQEAVLTNRPRALTMKGYFLASSHSVPIRPLPPWCEQML